MSDYQSINYSGVARAEAGVYRLLAQRATVYILSCTIIALVAGTLFPDYLIGFVVVFISIALIGLFIPKLDRLLTVVGIRERVSKHFASTNSFAYQSTTKPNYGLFPPGIDRLGWFSREEQVISGQLQGYPFRTYIHSYHHPYENTLARMYTRVYEITLPKRLPHIFLAVRRASGGKFLTSFRRHYDDDQRLRLEGNFEEMFIAYTHRRTATEALSILAPNVMATLIDTNYNFNVEIVGDKLYLYCEDYLPSENSLSAGFFVLERLMTHIDYKLRSWRFDLPNDNKYPFLRSRPGFGTAMIGGKYFNAAIIFILANAGWQGLKMVARFHDDPQAAKNGLILVAVFTIASLIVVMMFRNKHKSSLKAQ